MKQSLLVLSLALAQFATAAPLRFTLPCKVDGNYKTPKEVSKYEVAKVAFKGSNGKWSEKYELVTWMKGKTKPVVLPFVPGGSGDEDYIEYDLKASKTERNTVGVQGAYVQNQFRWVALVNTEGSGFARCEK